MSAEAVGWVWRHSPVEKSALLVHLALADVTNDMHGNQLWCAVKTIAKKTRLDRTTVMLALDVLVKRGLLAEKSRPGRTTLYQFRMIDTPVVFSDTRPEMPVWESDTPVGFSDTTRAEIRHELNRTQADNYKAASKTKCPEWADIPGVKAPTVAPCILDAGHDGPCEAARPLELVRERKDTA